MPKSVFSFVLLFLTTPAHTQAATADAAAAPLLGGMQQEELKLQAKLHFCELLKGVYDSSVEPQGPSVQNLARKPKLQIVKQVCVCS